MGQGDGTEGELQAGVGFGEFECSVAPAIGWAYGEDDVLRALVAALAEPGG